MRGLFHDNTYPILRLLMFLAREVQVQRFSHAFQTVNRELPYPRLLDCIHALCPHNDRACSFVDSYACTAFASPKMTATVPNDVIW